MTDLSITDARKGFFDLFDRVLRKGDRVIIARRGKDRVAIVPVEDLEKLQALEDAADIAAADAAMAEPGKSIPYDEVRKELGLE
jgi:prevent-host-death family protein